MKTNELSFYLSSSPHIGATDTVTSIMGNVTLALMPALAVGIWVFGLPALILSALSVGSCVAFEWICTTITKRESSIHDLSAVVTGLLLAFNLPPSAPLWLPVVGGAFAIVIVKFLFGGIGQNIVNPALAARAALLASWPVQMTAWTLDGVSTATPLAILKGGSVVGQLPSAMNLFIGNVAGCLGETSALALLIGGLWLIYRKIITWHIPVVYIVTVGLLTFLLGRQGFMSGQIIHELLAGGLFIGAFFMATDYTTSPVTVKGQVVFALGCGLLTTLIRLYGGYSEGVSYSILIMNLVTPLIDRVTKPRIFGEVAK